MLLRLFIAALWSLAGKGLASWLSFVMFNCILVTFPCGILGQFWFHSANLNLSSNEGPLNCIISNYTLAHYMYCAVQFMRGASPLPNEIREMAMHTKITKFHCINLIICVYM